MSFVPAALHPGHTGLCELRACWQPKGYLHGRRNCLRDSQDQQEDDGPTAFVLNSQPKRLQGTVCILGVVTDGKHFSIWTTQQHENNSSHGNYAALMKCCKKWRGNPVSHLSILPNVVKTSKIYRLQGCLKKKKKDITKISSLYEWRWFSVCPFSGEMLRLPQDGGKDLTRKWQYISIKEFAIRMW